ncbi:MAG: hypothetical protein R6W67_10190 [Bacteroidales bacterium]
MVETAEDTAVVENVTLAGGLYGGIGYGNNMIYLGSTISQGQPYAYTALSYAVSSEFYISFSSIHLSGLSPFLPINSGSITWSHIFNSWFDISAGLYGYLVAPSLRDSLFGNFLYGDLTIGFDWRILYSKISFGGLISDYSQAYLQFRNSRYFETPDIFGGRANISFDPYINIIAGTIITAETVTTTDTVFSTFPPFGRPGGRNETASETLYSRRIGLLEADIGLPVSLNFNKFTIEVEAGYILPLSSDYSAYISKGFVLMASAYFRIF